MKEYLKDRQMSVIISSVSFCPKLKNKQYDELWNINKNEGPELGKLIIAGYEDGHMELEVVSSDTDTDEIVKWINVEDLI